MIVTFSQANVRQLKDLKCHIGRGSGFKAAIKSDRQHNRGWKAAPTINKLLTLRTIGFLHYERTKVKFSTKFMDHYTSLYLSV